MPNPICKTTKHLRDKIKADELIDILQNNCLHPRRAPLHQNRVNAIKILLDRVLPTVKAVEQSTTIEGNVTANIQVEFIGDDKDSEKV